MLPGKDVEEYGEVEETIEGKRTGQCGVSTGKIGVPGPKDHYSNPRTVSSIPSVRSRSQSY